MNLKFWRSRKVHWATPIQPPNPLSAGLTASAGLVRKICGYENRSELVGLVFYDSNNPSRKQVICSFAGHADRARTTKAAPPSRSAIPSVSRAARRENANIRFIFSVLLRTFFAISGPFFFWKKVKTNAFNPNGEHLSKGSYDHFRCFFGHG